MSVSIFDLFSVGVGPSSSHTMGPMRAAFDFAKRLEAQSLISPLAEIQVTLFGSLACTGRGHHTDKAVLMGLEGYLPESVDPDLMFERPTEIASTQQLFLLQQKTLPFKEEHLVFNFKETLDYHVNGLRFVAKNAVQETLLQEQYYSVGGGFIVSDSTMHQRSAEKRALPFPYETAAELLAHCERENKAISDIVYANELAFHDIETIDSKLLLIWETMQSCIERGINTPGILPGGLNVKRRAHELHEKLKKKSWSSFKDKDSMIWMNLFALAVNEENGAGGRIVTAPTNGAAGIVPAVLNYFMTFYEGASFEHVRKFLLTAGGIAILYKLRASISGAEVGCQGEVGVACSMASGALAEILGGNIWQVENAAEIGMEHHLGLTCDPIGGLVQIPCIERNAMAAVRAVNAAQLALLEDGRHHVSLDQVIETMKRTGHDMMSIYKETSLGGLAVVYAEC